MTPLTALSSYGMHWSDSPCSVLCFPSLQIAIPVSYAVKWQKLDVAMRSENKPTISTALISLYQRQCMILHDNVICMYQTRYVSNRITGACSAPCHSPMLNGLVFETTITVPITTVVMKMPAPVSDLKIRS